MAIAEVSGQRASGNGNTGSATATFPGTPTVGHLLVATLTARAQGGVQPTLPAGWSIGRQHSNAGGSICSIYYKIAGASEPTSPAWTLNAAGNWVLHLTEYSGVATSTPLDKANSTNGASGTAGTTGATGALTVANELVVVCFANQSTATWSAHDNGLTEALETTQGATANLSTANRIVASTASVNYGATLSSSGAWQAAVCTFKEQPAGSYTLAASDGAYALTGQSATLKQAHLLAATGGSYALSGQTAILLRGKFVVADGSTYAIVGQVVTFRVAYRLQAEDGVFGWVGEEAALIHAIPVVMPAAGGVYNLSGAFARLKKYLGPQSIGSGVEVAPATVSSSGSAAPATVYSTPATPPEDV